MGQLSSSRTFDAPPDVVWAVMTDPELYARVAPNLESVEVLHGAGVGMVRRCIDTDGNAWTESCHTWDDGQGFAVAVDVDASPFHRRFFERFEGSWRLEERVDGVVVTIRFDFDTKYGPLGSVVSAVLASRGRPLLDAIFDGWEAAISDGRPDVFAEGYSQTNE